MTNEAEALETEVVPELEINDLNEHFQTCSATVVEIIKSGVLGPGRHDVAYILKDDDNPLLIFKILVDGIEWTRLSWKERIAEEHEEGTLLVENSEFFLSIIKKLTGE